MAIYSDSYGKFHVYEGHRAIDPVHRRAVSFSVEMGRWGDGEMGRLGDGEIGRWGDWEMGRSQEPPER
ncbi:MAG: hypothetical protein QQW96_22685 [Tychonema bourrellyi B0820]|nr:hypothetical protein [Tychonema bourrellyi B0820]